jgi:hypothetical protein
LVSLTVSVLAVGGCAAVATPAVANGDLGDVVRDNILLRYERVARAVTPVTGRGPTGSDFDGDGVDDIASTTHVYRDVVHPLGIRGGVVVLYSSLPVADYLYDLSEEAGGGGGSLGETLVAGDFNDDGFDDLAAGSPWEGAAGAGSGSGGVWVAPSGAGGLRFDAIAHITQDSPGIPGVSEPHDQFAGALAAGDVNGDGRDDLAIGAPGESIGREGGAGAVTVVFGSPTGLVTSGAVGLHQDLAAVPGRAERNDDFGSGLAVGRVNADRYADLVIGAPAENLPPGDLVSATGAVSVMWGSASGVALTGATAVTGAAATTAAATSGVRLREFAVQVAVTDTDDDGFGEVIVGAPMARVAGRDAAGAVVSLAGRSGGLSTTGMRVLSQRTAGVPGAAEEGDMFGSAIAVGDVDADHHGDVLVGTRGESVGAAFGAGSITLLLGGAAGLTGAGAQGFAQTSPGVPGHPEEEDEFGYAVDLLNLDGTGGLDAVIGAPWEDEPGDDTTPPGDGTGSFAGTITTFHAMGRGLSPVTSRTGPSLATGHYTPGRYGYHIAGPQAGEMD